MINTNLILTYMSWNSYVDYLQYLCIAHSNNMLVTFNSDKSVIKY